MFFFYPNGFKYQGTIFAIFYPPKCTIFWGEITKSELPRTFRLHNAAYWYITFYISMFQIVSSSGTRVSLQWRHNERNGISNHQLYDCLLNCLFRRRSTKKCKLRVTGLCKGNSPVTGEFPAQRVSNVESVSIWWRHHVVGQAIDLHTMCFVVFKWVCLESSIKSVI